MVLSSQMTRPGLDRRYMVSRRRRHLKWPWIGGAIMVVLLVYIVFARARHNDAPDPAGALSAAAGDRIDADTANKPDAASAAVVAPAPPPAPTPSTARAAAAAASKPRPNTSRPAPPAPKPSTNRPPTAAATTPKPAPTRPPVAVQPKTTPAPTPAPARVTPVAAPLAPPGLLSAVSRHTSTFGQGVALINAGKLVEARDQLSRILTEPNATLTPDEADFLRTTLARVNDDLLFSTRVLPNDPLVESYEVKQGEFLSVIGRRYKVPWELLERVNNVKATRIRAGMPIKVIKGPFHAVVDKSAFRMDVFLAAPGGRRIYIRSFNVGLGANDSTPVGAWIVQSGRKLSNPPWTNPRTGKFFGADDPANPIGERWIGLQGADVNTKGLNGYGIHGTIEPESIGKQKSMGCVRMLADDVALVYDLLYPGQSTVLIEP